MKRFFFGLFGIIGFAILGGGIFIASINPNDFKPLIVKEVRNATGREFDIAGDLQWSFFPRLGISVTDLSLKNPAGFAQENFLSFSRAEMSVDVIPLLSKELRLGVAKLDDASVFIQTRADGTTNLEFTPSSTSDEQALVARSASQPDEQVSGFNLEGWVISIEGLAINQASATILDDKVGSKTELSQLNLHLGNLGGEIWVPVEFDINGKQDALSFTSQGSAEIMLAPDLLKSRLRMLAFSATANQDTLSLTQAKVEMDELALDETVSMTFSASGESDGLGFHSQGQLALRLESETDRILLSDLNLKTDLDGASLPKGKMALGLTGKAIWQGMNKRLDLSDITAHADDIALSGHAAVMLDTKPTIDFALQSPKIDLDAFLDNESKALESDALEQENDAQSTATYSAAPTSTSASSSLSKEEPDLSFLKTFDLTGTIKVAEFVAANMHVDNLDADFTLKDGVVDINRFNANLYDGMVTTKARLNVNHEPLSFSITQNVKQVEIGALLNDAINDAFLTGKGRIQIDVAGRGLSAYRLRKSIKGYVGLSLTDGALYGINVPQMIREAKAALKGKGADYVDEVKKTDFSGLQVNFELVNGYAKTDDVKLEAPILRLHSDGKTNLVHETLDFNVYVSVVGTSKGQGGKDIDEVKNLTIPVKIIGSWSQPEYKIDFKSFLKANNALENKLKEKAEKGLNKLLGDKANNEEVKQIAEGLLNGLFNR